MFLVLSTVVDRNIEPWSKGIMKKKYFFIMGGKVISNEVIQHFSFKSL